MVSDTADATLNNACAATVHEWRETLKELVPSDQYTFMAGRTSMDSSDNPLLTAQFVRDVLGEARVKGQEGTGIKPNDTLVCLYHGHGGRFFGDHYMELSTGEWMYSHELQRLVNAVPCRLKVIMTCSCNAGILDRFFGALDREPWDVEKNGMAPVMKSLFIDHAGLLHMNASQPSHYSYNSLPQMKELNEETLGMCPDAGSWMFNEFLKYCKANPRATPSWHDIDRMLDERLTERFHKARESGSISRANGNFLSHQRDAKVITYSFAHRR
ncbi:MAG: hypothetical protein CMJ58_12580 [Planctomycetaceae bacterium]|nr:hypothetical protein [Planctomycetaceae bacterium]